MLYKLASHWHPTAKDWLIYIDKHEKLHERPVQKSNQDSQPFCWTSEQKKTIILMWLSNITQKYNVLSGNPIGLMKKSSYLRNLACFERVKLQSNPSETTLFSITLTICFTTFYKFNIYWIQSFSDFQNSYCWPNSKIICQYRCLSWQNYLTNYQYGFG